MTSVVVSDGGGNIVEYVTVVEEPQQVSLDSLFIKSKSLDKKQKSLSHNNLLVLDNELKSLGHCDASVFSSCVPYSDKAARSPIKFVKMLKGKTKQMLVV